LAVEAVLLRQGSEFDLDRVGLGFKPFSLSSETWTVFYYYYYVGIGWILLRLSS
jgi:hypothetical protein